MAAASGALAATGGAAVTSAALATWLNQTLGLASPLLADPALTSPLAINVAISLVAFGVTLLVIPPSLALFLDANMVGHDLSKIGRPRVPEAVGVVAGLVYLVAVFLFIPIPFADHLLGHVQSAFPLDKLASFLSALLSICCMILLGFADDVFNLRWRHKILLPTIATIPLLMVYYVSFGRTEVVLPRLVRPWLGAIMDLGPLYYLYMSLLAVFCTNAINILAGVNGVEAGQSLVIAASIALNNYVQLWGDCCADDHMFSLYLILPFMAVTAGLLWHNWYPSRAFVGDTFCYFAGMTFAVVGILGHFSKTMMLFFMPQIFNFILSAPQLFKLVDCPRHRMPRFNPTTGLLEPSRFSMAGIGRLGRLIVQIAVLLRLARVYPASDAPVSSRDASSPTKRGPQDGIPPSSSEVTNFTLINCLLVWFGPMHEQRLTALVLVVQLLGSAVAFAIRYPLAAAVYPADGS